LAESGGGFTAAYTRFWLFPTYFHQQRDGLKAEGLPFLEQAEADRPPTGVVRLSHFAEVAGIYHAHDLAAVLMLGGLHFWSDDTVQARFAYRQPSLYVLPVRVYRAAQVFELPSTPAYEGCRSWVELERALPTDGAMPVLDDSAFREVLQ